MSCGFKSHFRHDMKNPNLTFQLEAGSDFFLPFHLEIQSSSGGQYADADDKRYYRYLKNEDGQFVGEIAYHYDAEMQQEIANVMIYAKYRRRGYGGEALRGEKQRRFRSV